MKTEIHPKYYEKAIVKCACGNIFTVGSTLEEIHVEICSACHPFYTGKQKLVDTARRVEKFQARSERQKEEATKRVGKKIKKARLIAIKSEKKKKIRAVTQ